MWRTSGKKLFDNARIARLQVPLERIPKRKFKDSIERIMGDGSKVKGAIKKICGSCKRCLKLLSKNGGNT